MYADRSYRQTPTGEFYYDADKRVVYFTGEY